ncbi:hypothetical protein SKAU_G00345690 [Synaphobranchus kaupii]|uniref:Uncharacterized protein n=1 Tax=Synaphobranchus kaupii TaxID=118154 RepID=A0A9Q1EJF3_SYNKA|nr:hypothetical protein SKAU_G00345690 [Synaphobranchus kaupii]
MAYEKKGMFYVKLMHMKSLNIVREVKGEVHYSNPLLAEEQLAAEQNGPRSRDSRQREITSWRALLSPQQPSAITMGPQHGRQVPWCCSVVHKCVTARSCGEVVETEFRFDFGHGSTSNLR